MNHLARILLAVLLLLAALPSAAAEHEAAQGQVMIVLDASGSMWGQIEGEAKIGIARRVIRDLLADWEPGMALGVTVYGHRRKGDCKDIEVLVPVRPDGAAAVLAAIESLQPKGKTPLSDAVRIAADALKFTEERASVILVSDGKETCDVDPCALGRQLEAQGVDFTVHVIGFDVKASEQQGLHCLAENTGGRFATASNAGSLKKALHETVAEVKKQAIQPVEPKQAPPVKGLRLNPLLAEGGPVFEGEVNWWIFAKDPDGNIGDQPLVHQHRGRSGQFFKDIKPGAYVVKAEFADARHIWRRFDVELKDAASANQDLVFNVGQIRFDALVSEGGGKFPGDITWNILEPKRDLAGNWHKLTYFHRQKSGGVYLLPAGKWRVWGQYSDWLHIGAVKEIEVTAGGGEAHALVFNSGLVRFDNILAEGKQPFTGDVDYYVLAPKADLSGKRKELTYWYRQGTGKVYALPAGEWYVVARLADWEHIGKAMTIKVEPGGEAAHLFNFDVGRVRIDVSLAGQPFTGQVNWAIYAAKPDLAGKRREITYVNRKRSGVVVPLRPGEYLIRVENADQRQQIGTIEFRVQAGDEKPIVVELQGSG